MGSRKIDIAYRIATDQGLPLPIVQRAVNMVLEEIVEAVAAEGRLELRDFGVFKVRVRKAMIGRNPKTGEAVPLPKRRFVTFKMGQVMRERMNGAETKAVAPMKEKPRRRTRP